MNRYYYGNSFYVLVVSGKQDVRFPWSSEIDLRIAEIDSVNSIICDLFQLNTTNTIELIARMNLFMNKTSGVPISPETRSLVAGFLKRLIVLNSLTIYDLFLEQFPTLLDENDDIVGGPCAEVWAALIWHGDWGTCTVRALRTAPTVFLESFLLDLPSDFISYNSFIKVVSNREDRMGLPADWLKAVYSSPPLGGAQEPARFVPPSIVV